MEPLPQDTSEDPCGDRQNLSLLRLQLCDQWSIVDIPNGLSLSPNPKTATVFKSFAPNKFVLISTAEALQLCWPEIRRNKVLGFDIEQTFHNSYFGYICLIQISTPDQDYILDIIALRGQIKPLLQPLLEDPTVVKIFYAGDNDLYWLQRDFGLQLRTFFDIKTAALFLNKAMDCSLANLIEAFCEKGKMDKKQKKALQVSPWFQRPLTEEQLNYAAMDSHYLIPLRERILSLIFEKTKDFASILGLFERMEAVTQRKYQEKRFNKLEAFELFNKKFKEKKPGKIAKPEEEKKDEGQGFKDKKKAQFLFIGFSELRDQKARELNVGVEDVLSLDSLFELCKGENALSELISPSYQLPSSDSAFLKENCERIKKLYQANKIEIATEIENIQATAKKTYSNVDREKRKKERMKVIEELFTRKSPAYENCSILAPDGYMLCHCDQKKINWYIARGLADAISEDKKTIKLRFEPQGRGFSELDLIDHKFYTVDRDNQCVVCGNKEKYLKYHIVPLLYRQHFPNSFKSHRAHDVVLLCLECHERTNKETEKLKSEIAEKFASPINGINNPLLVIRNKVLTMAKFGLSFAKNKGKIPKERRFFLKSELRSYFAELQKEERVQKFLEGEISGINYNKKGLVKIDDSFFQMCKTFSKNYKKLKEISNKDFRNMHGKLVVEKMKSHEELKEFILMWRMNFVDRMKPKFLPQAWNVYHQFERQFGDHSKFYEKK